MADEIQLLREIDEWVNVVNKAEDAGRPTVADNARFCLLLKVEKLGELLNPTSIQPTELPPEAGAALKTLERSLWEGGWELTMCDINIDSGRTRIILLRRDRSLMVTFDAPPKGRASITREYPTNRVEKRGAGGCAHKGGGPAAYVSEYTQWNFLGRTWYEGARSGLRGLSHYLADNSGGRLTSGDAKKLLRPFMG